jgi:hypothetical protein
MNLYFLSFADSVVFGDALSRCEIQAKNFKDENGENVFKEIFCVNENDIKNNFPEFFEEHSSFIENNKRGYGYWIWKPYLILKLMETLDEDDVILYMDAGCQLNYSGLDRLKFYYDRALECGGVNFKLTHKESKFTKMDTYRRIFPDSDENLFEMQRSATSMILKCSEKNKKFLEEWYSVCIENSYSYVNDSQSNEKNDESFLDHRHDQSIFSLLVKRDNPFYELSDETYLPKDEWKIKHKDLPIWATRNRGLKLFKSIAWN